MKKTMKQRNIEFLQAHGWSIDPNGKTSRYVTMSKPGWDHYYFLGKAGAVRPGLRLLDVAYGPRSAELRAEVVSALSGDVVRKSDKRVQWTNWRRLMLEAIGASGDCIANADYDFEVKARSLLKGDNGVDAQSI